MTTLKEYKAMMENILINTEIDGFDLDSCIFELDEASRELCPSLIRVIELAESLINKVFIKNEDGSVTIPMVNLDIMNDYLETTSEIRKLRGW